MSGIVTAHKHRHRKAIVGQAAPDFRPPRGRHRLGVLCSVAYLILATVLIHANTAITGLRKPLGTLVAELRLGPQYCDLPVANLQSARRLPPGTYKTGDA